MSELRLSFCHVGLGRTGTDQTAVKLYCTVIVHPQSCEPITDTNKDPGRRSLPDAWYGKAFVEVVCSASFWLDSPVSVGERRYLTINMINSSRSSGTGDVFRQERPRKCLEEHIGAFVFSWIVPPVKFRKMLVHVWKQLNSQFFHNYCTDFYFILFHMMPQIYMHSPFSGSSVGYTPPPHPDNRNTHSIITVLKSCH